MIAITGKENQRELVAFTPRKDATCMQLALPNRMRVIVPSVVINSDTFLLFRKSLMSCFFLEAHVLTVV